MAKAAVGVAAAQLVTLKATIAGLAHTPPLTFLTITAFPPAISSTFKTRLLVALAME
jgi:hypothetical protein